MLKIFIFIRIYHCIFYLAFALNCPFPPHFFSFVSILQKFLFFFCDVYKHTCKYVFCVCVYIHSLADPSSLFLDLFLHSWYPVCTFIFYMCMYIVSYIDIQIHISIYVCMYLVFEWGSTHRLIYLSAWPPAIGTIWEGLGHMALLEECNTGYRLSGFKRLSEIPSVNALCSLSFPHGCGWRYDLSDVPIPCHPCGFLATRFSLVP